MKNKCTITNKIREHRFFANEMTQQQLAEIAGVSRQTIIAIEAGKYSPSLELAFKIANAFDVKIDQIFIFKMEVNHND
ncbi:MAG: helix-turn-helix transcriptional regulator [Spirochaetes bacterium]|nr:helix-turn-helix transcriptional regulator [Spirochaetota bacterium]MBN2772226.1 helix-turn-helix transcriptional regulator [Spirochaetota bacterium]